MVIKFTRLACLVVLLVGIGGELAAQTITSAQSGDWDDPATWNGGVVPTALNSTLVSIGNTHNITVQGEETANAITLGNNANSRITINSTGHLTISGNLTLGSSANRGRTEVAGILQLNDGAQITNAAQQRLIIQDGGTYRLNYSTGGVIYDGDFQEGSTLEFTGYNDDSAVAPTLQVSPKAFHHVVWNCTEQSMDIDLDGILSIIGGNLSILSTGQDQFFLMLSDGNNQNITVGGNFEVRNDSYVYLSGYSGGANVTLTVLGNVEIAIDPSYSFVLSGSGGDVVLDIEGDLEINSPSAQVYLTESSGDGTIDLLGDFILSAGTVLKGGSGTATLSFTGNAIHTFTKTGNITNAVNYSVASLSTLDLGTSFLSGSGSLTVIGTGTLQLGSLDAGGALQTGSSGGNIRVTGARTYSSSSTIVYNGLGPQFIGNGFPSSGNVNLTIANNAGVSLSDDLEIVSLRTLNLQSGNLVIGTQTLTINGTITGTGGLIGGDESNLVIGGTGDFGMLTFNGTTELLNFTIDRDAGEVKLGTNLRVVGTFTHANGEIDFSDRTLRISGAYASSLGTFKGNENSVLIIDGSGSITGGIPISGTIGTFTLQRSSGATIGAITISNALNLLSGTLTGDVEFEVQSPTDIPETLTRGNGALAGTLTAALYNLVYTNTGTISTGPELVDDADALNNFTLSGSGSVTLTQSLDINGNFSKSNTGTFNSGNFGISLAGNYSKTAGTTTYGSTVFTFDGNTTLSGSGINFTNILIANGATLNLGSSSVTFTGNINHTNGGTMVAGTGTVIFGGNTTLSFNDTNIPTFNNVTVNTGSTLAFSCGTCGNIAGNDTNLNAVRVAGNWNSNNTGAVFNPSEARVQLVGTNQNLQTLSSHRFFTLEFNGTGTITLVQPLRVDNDLLIGTTATLNTGNDSYTIEIGDDFLINGSFVANTGTVVFNGSATGNQNMNRIAGAAATIDFYNIHIDKPNGSFSVLATVPNTIFRVANEFRILQNSAAATDIDFDGSDNSGRLVLLSTNARTARIPAIPSGVAVIGNITVQRYIQNEASVRAYRYLASPVSGATVDDWLGEIQITGLFSNPSSGAGIPNPNTPSMYRWVETAGGTEASRWQAWPNNIANPASSFALENGRGYGVFVRNTGEPTVDVRGTLNVGNVNVALTVTGSEPDAAGYNLIGNPYPAPVSWDAVDLPTGVSPMISLKNNVNNNDTEIGNYAYYTQDGPSVGYTGTIASGQAFWVTTTQNTTLQFTEAAKVSTANPVLLRERSIANVLRMKVQGNGRGDETVIYFRDEATNGYDVTYDARKRKNDYIDLYSYQVTENDTVKYAINAMKDVGCAQQLKIGFDGLTTGTYHFTFAELESFASAYSFTLIDNFAGASVSLSENNDYTFQVTSDAASKSKGRFVILISKDNIDKALAVTGTESCNASGLKVKLSGSQPGISYQPYWAGATVGQPVMGTGGMIELLLEGEFLAGNTYEIAVKGFSECGEAFLDQKAVVEVTEIEPAQISSSGNILVSNYETGNSWFYEGSQIEGATGKELVATASGLYKLVVTTANGCTSVAESMFVITGTENPLSKVVSVYANPFVDKFKVEVTLPGVVSTRVMNSSGMVVAEKILDDLGPVKSGEYDMSSFSDGMFILEIRAGKMIHSVKIIKGLK